MTAYGDQIAYLVPDDWVVRPFEELVFFQEGPGIRNWQYVEKGVPFVNIRCLVNGRLDRPTMNHVSIEEATGRYKHFLLDEDDYVVSSSGTLGRIAAVAASDLPCMLNTSVIRMRPRSEELDRTFLKYFLLSSYYQNQILSFATGSAQLNYGPAHLRQMFIVVPPIKEQRAIAHILGTLDDKIELNRRMNQTLEAMARALFKSWFVDFDGVPAEDMQESELGLIPKGWRVIALGDVAEQGKGSISPENTPKQTFTHYSLPAFDVAQLPLLESGDAIKSNKTPVPDNSVLVSKLNPHIPRIWLVGDAGDNAVCSTEFTVWTPKQPANSAFVYCLASSSMFNDAMRQLVTGTSNSHQRVRPEQLANIRVIAANNTTIAKFSEAAAPLMQKLLHHRQQSQALAHLRDALLPRLLSGHLRITKFESQP